MVSLRRLSGVSTARRARRSPAKARPGLESLESRVVLSYTLSGDQWPNPQLITISFIPDGVKINGVSSNLFATFNARYGSAAAWENIILKAAQTWAAQTNINFAMIPDDGVPEGQGPDQQGDPGQGDIRIGGYNFNSSTLALALMPPPANNYSGAGDVTFNTGAGFGTSYDLFTVAAHEIGHALGLYHGTVGSDIMYSSYNGTKTALATDDIQGIRAIYSGGNPRTPDVYNSGGANDGSFATAANLTIDPGSLTDLVTGLDVTTAGQVEYYKFTVPSGTNGTLQLHVQSSGLSLLAPKVTVYASDQVTVLGSASGLGQYGTTLAVTVSGVTANQQLYVKVQGADTTVFGTGAYAMTLNVGSGPNPTVPLPNTTVPDGYPLQAGGGQADTARLAHDEKHGDTFEASAAFRRTAARSAYQARVAASHLWHSRPAAQIARRAAVTIHSARHR